METQVKSVTRWYVEFLYPGAFLSETSCHEIEGLDSKFDLPKNAFAYTLYSVEIKTTEVNGEVFDKKNRINIPGVAYIDGQIKTLDDIPNTPEFRILRSNMEGNGYSAVVYCRTHNYQPFYPDVDKVVSS